MPTITPCNTQARMISITSGIGLVFNTRLIQVVTADCARVCADSPRPHGYSVPFLDLKSLAKFVLALHIMKMSICAIACGSICVYQQSTTENHLFLIRILLLHLHIHGFCLVSHGFHLNRRLNACKHGTGAGINNSAQEPCMF